MPTKVRLRHASIAGEECYNLVQNIKVYESMCTPYIKAELTIVDNKGFIAAIAENRTGGLAGLPVKFSFDDGENTYKRDEQVILTVDASPSEENKRVQVYNIGTIGISYVNDRQNMVQRTFKNIPATGAASRIHNEFLGTDAGLRLINSSLGFIAKDTIGSFPISNLKPFKAIEDLLKRAKYGSAANPTVYFRNRDSYVMGPLQDIFAQASPVVTVEERATWGASMNDMFVNAHYAIIGATLLVDEEDIKKKRNKLGMRSAAAYQNLNVFNNASQKIEIDKPATATAFASMLSFLSGGGSKLGGLPNILHFNELRNDFSQDPSISRQQEMEFLAAVADADKYLVKVPIRAGLKCTVGQGVNAKILAPPGARTRSPVVGGQMLVADLMHDCYFDKRTAMATSTFRGVSLKDVQF